MDYVRIPPLLTPRTQQFAFALTVVFFCIIPLLPLNFFLCLIYAFILYPLFFVVIFVLSFLRATVFCGGFEIFKEVYSDTLKFPTPKQLFSSSWYFCLSMLKGIWDEFDKWLEEQT